MTQDSGSERPQRTVAELLAEYGGSTGDAPRRRRRRAEDDGDSAPQTIIERVLSDSGKLLPIREDQPPASPRRTGGHRSGEHRPTAPQQPQQQPPPQSAPPPQPPTAYSEPVRPQGRPARRPRQQPPRQPAQPPTQQQQPVQQPPTQQQLPTQQQPPGQPPQFPPSRPGLPPVGQQTGARPVPGTQSARLAHPQTGRTPVGPQASRPQQAPQRPRVDDDATAVHPPLPDFAPDFAPPQDRKPQPPVPQPPVPPAVGMPPTAGRPGALPPEATTEEFPLVPAEAPPAALAPPAPPTRRHPPTQPPAALESTQAHGGPYVDDEDDQDFPAEFAAPHADDEPFRRDDFDRQDYGDDFDDEDEDAPAGGREWLLMVAQVAVGAIAGAAVWLAFSWLWGFQSVVAIVVAVLVIIGLVFGVRRWRRADDVQTTVLAVVAGLVVTVSPAALLLLHH
jgi:hypothetical protein